MNIARLAAYLVVGLLLGILLSSLATWLWLKQQNNARKCSNIGHYLVLVESGEARGKF
jgi:hypothetical protein